MNCRTSNEERVKDSEKIKVSAEGEDGTGKQSQTNETARQDENATEESFRDERNEGLQAIADREVDRTEDRLSRLHNLLKFSPSSFYNFPIRLPLEIHAHILSFLDQQRDLLIAGSISKSWRQAAEIVWKHKPLDLSNKNFKLIMKQSFGDLSLLLL